MKNDPIETIQLTKEFILAVQTAFWRGAAIGALAIADFNLFFLVIKDVARYFGAIS